MMYDLTLNTPEGKDRVNSDNKVAVIIVSQLLFGFAFQFIS